MRIKLTAKRQATFPRELCEEMRLEPGNAILVEPAVLEGRKVWVLSPQPACFGEGWTGVLRRYAAAQPHSMVKVRERMLEGMAHADPD